MSARGTIAENRARSSGQRTSAAARSPRARDSRAARQARYLQQAQANVVSLATIGSEDEDDIREHDRVARPAFRRQGTGHLSARSPSPAGSDEPPNRTVGYSNFMRSTLPVSSQGYSTSRFSLPRDESRDKFTRSATASMAQHHRFDDSVTAATAHFKRATVLGKRLDSKKEKWDALKADAKMDTEMTQKFQSVAHLTDELDGLFAEMGRQTAVLRSGQKCELRLIGGITRTVEVRLPRPREDGEEMTVQVECRCNPNHHATDEDGHRQGLPAEENFDVHIADTQRQVPDGPFRAHSTHKPSHRLRFTTDNLVLWVCFLAKRECHLNFTCKSLQGGQQATAQTVERSALRDSVHDRDDDDEEQPAQMSASVGKKLQAKLKVRKQDLAAEQANEETLRKIRKDSEEMAAAHGSNTSSAPPNFLYRMQHFSEWLFDGQKPPRDEQQIMDAKKRILYLMLGPCNKYTRDRDKNYRRATGSWVKSLSVDCPRKLIRFLRKAEQDRQALTMLAAVGGFSFFLRRQRELHLMRARAALRQLVWHKLLFAASRLRYMMVFCAKTREEALQKARERLAAPYSRMRTREAEDSDSGSDSERPVEEVRRYVNLFMKMHPGPGTAQRLTTSAGHSTGASRPTAHAIQTESSTSLLLDGSPSSPSDKTSRRTLDPQRPGSGNQSIDKFRHRRALVSEEQLLEWRLASQGFFVHPQPGASGTGHGHGARCDKGSASSRPQQQDVLHTIAESLGRQVISNSPPPLGIEDPQTATDDSHDQRHSKAMHEVSSSMLVITVRPEEIAKLREASAETRIQQIGSSSFRRFYRESASRAAHSLVKRQTRQAKVEPGGNMPMKISKRYLLQFFEEEQADLTWLPIMQSLMLVIKEKMAFHSAHEHYIFETKLRSFKEARKAAMRGSGLFRPLEAALWTHPKIVARATRLQRHMCRGDGALAWKSSLFEGSYQHHSDRDVTGETLNTKAIPGHRNSKILRELADISGRFVTETCAHKDDPALAAELTPHQPQCVATKTSSGYPVRTLGEHKEGFFAAHELHLDILPDSIPRDLRIENLRRRRKEKAKLEGPRQGHELIAHSDLKAQKTFGNWMMRTDVPAKVRRFKAQMQPFFEDLVAIDAPTFSKPLAADAMAQAGAAQKAAAERAHRARRAARKSPRPNSTVSEKSDGDTDMEGHVDHAGDDMAKPKASSLSPSKAQAPGADGTKGDESREPMPPEGTKCGSVAHAHVGARGSLSYFARQSPDSAGSDAHSVKSKRDEEPTPSPDSARKPLSVRGAPVAPPAPQTADEVGRLFMQSDALQTILSLDASEIGGFAHRCPAGWNSGYRVEPMSKDEIRKARIVEKFSSSKLNF